MRFFPVFTSATSASRHCPRTWSSFICWQMQNKNLNMKITTSPRHEEQRKISEKKTYVLRDGVKFEFPHTATFLFIIHYRLFNYHYYYTTLIIINVLRCTKDISPSIGEYQNGKPGGKLRCIKKKKKQRVNGATRIKRMRIKINYKGKTKRKL